MKKDFHLKKILEQKCFDKKICDEKIKTNFRRKTNFSDQFQTEKNVSSK
jgi:hypothetical protein